MLSQNTNDRNRDVAYSRLRDRFQSWAEVRDAPVADVEEAIRPGGLAPRVERRRLGYDRGDALLERPHLLFVERNLLLFPIDGQLARVRGLARRRRSRG